MKARQFVLAALAAIVTIPAMAAEPVLVKAATTTPLATSASAAVSSSTAVEIGYADWEGRFKRESNNYTKGKIIFGAGLGVGVLSRLMVSGGEASLGRAQFAYKLSWVGLGVGAYGGWKVFQSKEKVADLREEGMRNGYYKVRVGDGLTIVPSGDGVQAKLALSF